MGYDEETTLAFLVINYFGGCLELLLGLFALYSGVEGWRKSSSSSTTAAPPANGKLLQVSVGDNTSDSAHDFQDQLSSLTTIQDPYASKSSQQTKQKKKVVFQVGRDISTGKRRQLRGPFHVIVVLCMAIRAAFHFAQPYYTSQARDGGELYPFQLWLLSLFTGNVLYEIAFVFLLIYCFLFYYELRDIQQSGTAKVRAKAVTTILKVLFLCMLVIYLGVLTLMIVFWNFPTVVYFIDVFTVILFAFFQALLLIGLCVFLAKLSLVFHRMSIRSARAKKPMRRTQATSAVVALCLFLRLVVMSSIVYELIARCWSKPSKDACDGSHEWIIPWPFMFFYFFFLEWAPIALLVWFLRKAKGPQTQPAAATTPLVGR